MALAEELGTLAPFGRGNPAVSLLVRSALLSDRRPMGEGKHLRFTVDCGDARARAVAFGNGGRLPVAEEQAADATFTLEVNEWNGVSEPRLVLRHVQASTPAESTVANTTPEDEVVQQGLAERKVVVPEMAPVTRLAEDPASDIEQPLTGQPDDDLVLF
jgi:hypothetical protein